MTEPDATNTAAPAKSRRWRTLWRVHFYAGMFSLPFIVVMALSGLVILYAQPIEDATQDHLRSVTPAATVVDYDAQERAVEAAFPGAPVVAMTVGRDANHSTAFHVDDGSKKGRDVFVDPYRATVLGSAATGGGVVGLANRLHGYLNNDSLKVSLPSVSALWDDGKILRPYVVGDLVLEMLGTWTLVLVLSGIYLWWPRRASAAARQRRTRGLLRVRLAKGGRARWRDLHSVSGVLLLSLILVTIVSGLAWSTYWGQNFTALADEVSPNGWTDAPASVVGTRGDLDVLGNTIPWNTASIPIPASYRPTADGNLPAPMSLDAIVTIARSAALKPGFTVNFPTNSTDEATAKPVYGSFTVSNSWPRKTGEAHDLFLDQFTGRTLAQQTAYGFGAVSYGMDTLVSTHMGTQLGLVSRVLMTAVCVLSLWSVVSALTMYRKRRRPGTAGLPRRPLDVRLGRRLDVIAVVLAIVYPVWGVTAALVLGVDRFVIRRSTPLRAAFGQR